MTPDGEPTAWARAKEVIEARQSRIAHAVALIATHRTFRFMIGFVRAVQHGTVLRRAKGHSHQHKHSAGMHLPRGFRETAPHSKVGSPSLETVIRTLS